MPSSSLNKNSWAAGQMKYEHSSYGISSWSGLKGILTPAERQLAKTVEGVDMVKRLRQNLIALGRDKLCEQVIEITGAKTLALFTDIDVQIGERVFVFTLDRDIQNGSR